MQAMCVLSKQSDSAASCSHAAFRKQLAIGRTRKPEAVLDPVGPVGCVFPNPAGPIDAVVGKRLAAVVPGRLGKQEAAIGCRRAGSFHHGS